MIKDSAKLATLVGSRLCHDLVSPVGAIGNGLELIALSGGQAGAAEMALIEDSCASARARISFFRVAFGSASGEQMIGPREAGKLLADVCAGSRLSAEWLPVEDLSRAQVQLAFLAHLCCESALPLGGRVQVAMENGGWRISGTGPRLLIEDPVWDQLGSDRLLPDITPARVHFACLAQLAPERGRRIESATGEAAVTIRLL